MILRNLAKCEIPLLQRKGKEVLRTKTTRMYVIVKMDFLYFVNSMVFP